MRRHIAWLLLVVVGTAAGLWGFRWWEERPLAEVRSKLESDQPRDALHNVNRFLDTHPRSDTALLLKARALTELGRTRQAERIFETVGATEPDDLHAWGRCLISRGQWSAALLPLEQVIASHPGHADALYEASVCWSRLGQHDRALVHAHLLAGISGYETRGWLLVGTLHDDSDNKAMALEAWDRVQFSAEDGEGLQVSSAEFHLAYARTALELGRQQAARRAIDKSLSSHRSADGLIVSGETAFRDGQLELARGAWTEAIEHPELSTDAERLTRVSLARIELQQRSPQAALKWLEPLDDNRITSHATYLFQRAHTMLGHAESAAGWQERTVALRSREKHASAIQQALIESPRSYWSRVIQAHRFAEQGNPGQALLILGRLPDSDSENHFAVDLAEAIRSQGTLPSLDRLPIERF